MKCGITFTPRSGASRKCDSCRNVCESCGGPKSDRTNNICIKCAAKHKRVFSRKCETCSSVFYDKNNRTRLCDSCAGPKKVCLDCGVSISSCRAKRCNSCARVHVAKSSDRKPSGWRRYEHDGIRYRSKWEVETAKLLNELGLDFEYERIDMETKTRPDFWIPSVERYLEIHPDIYGAKKPVKDCIVVKTREHALVSVFAVGFAKNPAKAKKSVESMKMARLNALERWITSLCAYLRQAIYERDGK